MPVTTAQRQAILRAARSWLGTKYDDTHGDVIWKDLSATPSAMDCSTFICRVAMEALGYPLDLLAADAGWLIDNLVELATPEPGDVVGYGRAAVGDEVVAGYDRVWHVMLYAGNGLVIGACDLKRAIVTRPVDYKPVHGRPRRWRFVGNPPAPFRRLEVR